MRAGDVVLPYVSATTAVRSPRSTRRTTRFRRGTRSGRLSIRSPWTVGSFS
jgi:hypothetical protein